MIDNLSHSLQSTHTCACEEQQVLSLTITSLQSIQNNQYFDSEHFLNCTKPRRKFMTLHFHAKVRLHIDLKWERVCHLEGRIYFEAVDIVMVIINYQFNQKGFKMLQKLETIVSQCTSQSQTLWHLD